MIRHLLTLTLLLTAFLSCCAQSKIYFPHLTRVSIDTTYKVFFGYDKKNSRLINKPCYSLDKKDPLYCDKTDYDPWVVVAKFKVDHSTDSLILIYSEGISDDPGFFIYNTTDKRLGRFSCLELYLNTAGTIYTSGHTNNLFDIRRKYQVEKDTVLEIKQPYYYVGLKGKCLKEITLYADKSGDEIVARLPKGYEIEIILADPATIDYAETYNFLLKTDFGLVGWLRISNEDTFGTILKELYFAGD